MTSFIDNTETDSIIQIILVAYLFFSFLYYWIKSRKQANQIESLEKEIAVECHDFAKHYIELNNKVKIAEYNYDVISKAHLEKVKKIDDLTCSLAAAKSQLSFYKKNL
jgi:hypothetical protein